MNGGASQVQKEKNKKTKVQKHESNKVDQSKKKYKGKGKSKGKRKRKRKWKGQRKTLSINTIKKIMELYNNGSCKHCRGQRFCFYYVRKHNKLYCEEVGLNAFKKRINKNERRSKRKGRSTRVNG